MRDVDIGSRADRGRVVPLVRRRLRPFLEAGAESWQMPERKVLLLWSVPVLILFSGAASALFGKPAYKWFTGEDGFAEWGQVAFYAVALGVCGTILRRLVRRGTPLAVTMYVLLALGLVFLIGEEISWGQRIFGWETAADWAAINKQAETNLHNVQGVGTSFKWIQLLVGAYGSVLPLALMYWTPPEKLRGLAEVVVPHFTLVPFFAPMFAWRMFRNFFDVPDFLYFAVAEYNEVVELALAAGFLFFLVHVRRTLAAEPPGFRAARKAVES